MTAQGNPRTVFRRAIEGHDLGAVDLARPDWPPGVVFYRGASAGNLRVIGNEPAASDGLPVLVVEPAR